MPKTVTFIGPRPKALFGYTKEPYDALEKALLKCLDYLYDDGLCVITCGHQGFDQTAFWATETFRDTHPDVRNHIYIPCLAQATTWPANGDFGRDEYARMLKRASFVRDCEKESDGIRQIAELARNASRLAVNASDVIVGCSAAKETKDLEGVSGLCAYTMRHALASGKATLALDPTTHTLTRLA